MRARGQGVIASQPIPQDGHLGQFSRGNILHVAGQIIAKEIMLVNHPAATSYLIVSPFLPLLCSS